MNKLTLFFLVLLLMSCSRYESETLTKDMDSTCSSLHGCEQIKCYQTVYNFHGYYEDSAHQELAYEICIEKGGGAS